MGRACAKTTRKAARRPATRGKETLKKQGVGRTFLRGQGPDEGPDKGLDKGPDKGLDKGLDKAWTKPGQQFRQKARRSPEAL